MEKQKVNRANIMSAIVAGLGTCAGIHINPLQALSRLGRSSKPRIITEADLNAKQAAEEKRLRKNAKRLAQLAKDKK